MHKLGNDHVAEMEKCNKYAIDKREVHFDSLANNYEGLYLRVGYPDPKEVAEMVKKHTKKKDVKILDLACGTGLIGKYLSEMGFTNIDGVDCSSKMLEEAASKKVYHKLDKVTLGQSDLFPNYLKKKYDVVTVAGLINNNYLDY